MHRDVTKTLDRSLAHGGPDKMTIGQCFDMRLAHESRGTVGGAEIC